MKPRYTSIEFSEDHHIFNGTLHAWNGWTWKPLQESMWHGRKFPTKPTKDEIYENRLVRSIRHKCNQSKDKR